MVSIGWQLKNDSRRFQRQQSAEFKGRTGLNAFIGTSQSEVTKQLTLNPLLARAVTGFVATLYVVVHLWYRPRAKVAKLQRIFQVAPLEAIAVEKVIESTVDVSIIQREAFQSAWRFRDAQNDKLETISQQRLEKVFFLESTVTCREYGSIRCTRNC